MTQTVDQPTIAPELSVVEQIQLRAAVEPEFRAAVLADPRAVFAEYGVQIPEAVAVRTVESGAEEFVLAIPAAVDVDGELSEDALAGTSGGLSPFAFIPGIMALTAANGGVIVGATAVMGAVTGAIIGATS
ncbi:hypothetical protein GIS00_23165 [Nakamurella sp. YIM 132087]|uniref:Nitrile hydratase alpha/Thiocyanate hydrolase gamma domain-containing protein n=1 Tax=Nakamurella alba TaxID=2665158 RepID=A0A7K1FRR4_9ACTN|nr:nitrile hydratase subunit alpha [Nakamurella alba]MTD16838.1 hypothetical protein [Nakamurella alba]